MYELVNTSVVNGLLAGTHGFATVAMTRGMEDGVRARLESFCGYQHVVNAHDESFYRENPVNWFHVVMPQVGHILGRVAPCEFDYTGRTNRLARLMVLGEEEMVRGKSAADILCAKGAWWKEAWAGEPRYLEEDKGKVLELQQVGAAKSLEAWREVFGVRGEELAQKVAWQIEKNLMGDGRSIYFRTSAGWDVSGEKLVRFFAEVIGLVAEGMRGAVTFATYPAAMPSEVECLLRGSFAVEDELGAAEGVQAWVDCVEGRVVHEELLPAAHTDWTAMLDEARRENGDLKGIVKNLQAANAVLDKECARMKEAYQKLEAEYAELRKEHEKLKCTLLMCTGKLRAGGEQASEEKVPRTTLGNLQIQPANAPKREKKAPVDTGLKLIMAAGFLIIALIMLGVTMVKYSEALSLSIYGAPQAEGEK